MKTILFSIVFLISTSAFAEDHPWPYPDQNHQTSTRHYEHKNDHSVTHHPDHYKNHKSHHLHGDTGTSNK